MSATWTNPTDRTQGDLISASDWNNLIGEDGSLDYANNLRGRKNFIINGDMRIAQRGTSFVSPSSTSYTLDRFQNTYSQDTGATTISQSTTTPDFFGNSLKIDCTTAETSVDASNYWLLRQSLEGQDLQNLGYGTSNAKSITISFWVYSTKTGTFSVSLYNADAAYSYVADVSISSASTWEYKTVTIAGDTANGFDNDNDRSLILNIGLNAGSTFQTTAGSWTSGAFFGTSNTDNFLDSTSNDFYITGVQMEVGTVATDFEIRPIAEELALCQRYFEIAGSGSIGRCTSSTNIQGIGGQWKVNKRTNPTLTLSDTSIQIGEIAVAARTSSGSSLSSFHAADEYGVGDIGINGFSSLTSPNMVGMRQNFLNVDAEL